MHNHPQILCFGRFYDKIPGGMQKHIEHLFHSLKNKVQYTHLVPSRDKKNSKTYLHGFPVIRTASFNLDGSLAISPKLFSIAKHLHQQHQFDIVHLHFPDPMSHLASLALPSHIPRIVTWHADITRQKFLLKLYRPLLRKALHSASAIITPTPAHISSSNELQLIKDKNRFHIIPFGFFLGNFTQPHIKTNEIKQQYSGQRIFALGRHVYYKGFDVLIKAVRQLPDSTQLLIGGTGPLTESWRTLAEQEGVSSRVHFLGLIPDEDLPAYYQACDIFCLPAVSPAEAFGIVQVEAMAAGKPVISTRLNNGVDFVNQHNVTGLTVEPGSVESLVQALAKLLNDQPLCEQLGRQACERALSEFSLEAMGSKTYKLYQQVIAKTQP